MHLPSLSRLAGRSLILCALVAPFTLLSADTAAASDQDISPAALPDVLVTARRVSEESLNVPAYTQVISRDQIRESGATNLIDLLEQEANIQFNSFVSSPTSSNISMRGTGGSSANGNSRTLVLLDGIRTNRPDMGQFNWLQFNLQSIESVEIIQGPQGAFYGDNAVGGVIKINTLGNPQESGGVAQVLVGSEATVRISASYTERGERAWATLSGGYNTSDGFRDHSGYESSSITLGLGYDNLKNSITRLNLSYQDNTFDQPGALTKAQLDQNPKQVGTSIGNGDTQYRRLSLSNEYGAGPNAKLLTDIGVNRADEFFNAFADMPFNTRYNRDIYGYFFSPKLQFTSGAFTFTPGIDLNYDRVDVTGTTPVDSTVKRTVISPYLLSEWQLSEQLTFSAGFRHEWNHTEAEERVVNDQGKRRDTANAWQLAVNYRPTDTLRLYAKYDHAYRFPATDELAYYQGFPSLVFFDRNLTPETSDNFEIGANLKRGGWSAGVSAYYLKTTDEIFFNNATFMNQNLPETRRVGSQASIGYKGKIAGFRSQVDYVNADLVKGGGAVMTGPLRMVPEWRTTTTVFVTPVKNWTASLTHRHLGDSYIDDFYATNTPAKVKAEEVFDAKLTFKAHERLSIYAGINNLFDRTTVSYASTSFGSDSYYPGQGRFIYGGATLKF